MRMLGEKMKKMEKMKKNQIKINNYLKQKMI